MPAVEQPPIPLRIQLAVYGAAMFSNTMSNLVWVAMPLWMLKLGLTPFLVGIALGSRYAGPVLLSIHGGALMDRFGTRRVIIVLAVVGAVTALLFPLLPTVWAVIPLQLVGGLADAFCWVGAQTLVGQVMRGEAVYAGRMSACTRVGIFFGPPAIGLAWDRLGPTGAFAVMSLWAVGILVSVLMLPAAAVVQPPPVRLSLRSLLPSLADYVDAIRLLAVPALMFAMTITVLRQVGAGIQGSFYVVYLESIGVTGTMIGLIMTVNGIVGLAGSLTVAPLLRRVSDRKLLLWTSAASVLFVAITPLLPSIALLTVASGLRGWVLAASLVLIVSLIAQSAGPTKIGKAMGLRVTVNQAMSAIVPVIMGGVTELVGIDASFYWTGGIALALFALTGWHAARVERASR
jgi:MFS family permease